MKKIIILLVISLSLLTMAEDGKWVLSGNVGFNFGNVSTLQISPRLGYRVTPRLTTGLGLGYVYYKNSNYEPNLSQNIYSALAYANYQLLEQIYLHGEYDYTSFERVSIASGNTVVKKERDGTDGLLLGAGMRLGGGGRAGFVVEVLYDVLHDEKTSYRDEPLVIRGGIRISL